MKKTDQVRTLLRFALRARKVTLGMEATLNAIRKGKCQVIILAKDLSENSKTKIVEQAEALSLPVFTFSTKDEFGLICGRDEVGIMGIVDPSFAKGIRDCLISGE